MLLFKALKQMDDRSCLTTCLAMIVGESIEYVEEFFRGSNGRTAADAIIFLAHHGIFLGTFAIPADGEEYLTLSGKKDLQFELQLENQPALITVQSERFPDTLHSVFWNGYEVLDPSPLVIGPRSLDSYEIVEVFPLLLTRQRAKRLLRGGEDI